MSDEHGGTSWVDRAEAALAKGASSEGVTVLAGSSPPVLDAVGRRALLAPLLAAFMWAAVVFRETVQEAALDPLGLVFRLLALALTARSVILGVSLARRVRALLDKSRYALALGDEGLVLRTPRTDFAVPKSDILDIREHGAWADSSGRRWAEVYVVTRPSSGRTHLALPPLFDATPGVLAERLMRWRGAAPLAKERAEAAPTTLPSKLFDAAAAGEAVPGSAVIRHGNTFLRRGPYATVLLGLAVLSDWIALPAPLRAQTGMLAPLVMGFSLLLVPAVWLLWMRLDLKPRKGIALLLTPAEMLMRTRAGVYRVAWGEIDKLEITARTSWSVLLGPHAQRALVIRRKSGPEDSITYVEEFLGAPAEVVLALCEGYRKRVLP